MTEIRGEIYRQVLLEKPAGFLNKWKRHSTAVPITNSSEYCGLFATNDASLQAHACRRRRLRRGRQHAFAKARHTARDRGAFFQPTKPELYSHQDISSIEQAGKTESGTERETDGEVSIEEETACERRRKSEKTEYLLDKEMKCRRGWHVPAPATSIKHNTWTLERGFYLAI